MTEYVAGAANVSHVHEYLSEYLSGTLSDADRQTVDQHVRGCARCAADLQTLRLTVSALRRLPLASVPRSFVIPAVARAKRPLSHWFRWSTGALAAVFVVVLTLGVVGPVLAPELIRTPAPAAVQAPAVAPTNRSAPPPTARAAAISRPTASQSGAVGAVPAAAPAAPAPPAAGRGPAASSVNSAVGAAPSATTSAAAAAAPAPPSAGKATTDTQAGSNAASGLAAVATPTSGDYPPPGGSAAVPTPQPVGTYPNPGAPLVLPTPPPPVDYPTAEALAIGTPTAAASFPTPLSPQVARRVANGPTTWFTPALALLALLTVISAIVMSWLGRRGR